MIDIVPILTSEFSIKDWQVQSVMTLIDEGNTIPFIARYRKEQHGELDDQTIRTLVERMEYLRGLNERRQDVFNSITEQEKMTPEIEKALKEAKTLAEIEDIYRPYRPKRTTRASIARSKGLEPLAELFMAQPEKGDDPLVLAEQFIDEEKEVKTAEEALQGAMDIIAEDISDNADIRSQLRDLYGKRGIISTVVTNKEKDKEKIYDIYYEFKHPVSKISGYQVLAINRGEREDMLRVTAGVDIDEAMLIIEKAVLEPHNSPYTQTIIDAGEDSYARLIHPSIEREIRNMLTDNASSQAIHVFADNLRPLLMQPPLKGKTVMGLDPGYRTGCKVAVVDATGKVLDSTAIFITHSERQKEQAKLAISAMIKKHNVNIISIGNGTASQETEMFAAEVVADMKADVAYIVVDEAGASVYSASKLGAEEFPEFDVTIRGAISIARRLQDPLAELVKIDPQSIGVGQYQHDMPKKQLANTLVGVVEDCVNNVGVDLNTASSALLSKVSGINAGVANNIVAYRNENGSYTKRATIKKVPRLGAKAFEQAAGFLRVPESKDTLDNTAVHPESYKAAKGLLKLCSYTSDDVKKGNLSELDDRVGEIGRASVAEQLDVGLPTLSDIIAELRQPGRDPRSELPQPQLRTETMDMDDLYAGMEMTGTVRNVTDFGAFVDLGVHQDGLVHISQLADRFIKKPSDVVTVGDIVTVWVVSVEKDRGRIGLSMRGKEQALAAVK